MQEQFPFASIELVQRYEHELARVHHLNTKSELQQHNISAVRSKITAAADAHTIAMNKILAQAAALQAKIEELSVEHRQLDRQIDSRAAALEKLSEEVGASRIRFANHFISAMQYASATTRDRLTPSASGKPRIGTAGDVSGIDPALVLADGDATRRAFVLSALSPTAAESAASVELLERVESADAAVHRRAAAVLLQLASESLQRQLAAANAAFDGGVSLPHQHEASLMRAQAARDEIRGAAERLAIGRPLMRAKLFELLKLDPGEGTNAHAEPVSPRSTVTTSKALQEGDAALLAFSRPAADATDSKAALSAATFASPNRHDAVAHQALLDARTAVQALRQQIAADEDALALPNAASRLAALREIDNQEFASTRHAPSPAARNQLSSPPRIVHQAADGSGSTQLEAGACQQERTLAAPRRPATSKPRRATLLLASAQQATAAGGGSAAAAQPAAAPQATAPASAPLGWRSNVVRRPASASRYERAAKAAGASGVERDGPAYDPTRAAPFRFRNHATLELAAGFVPPAPLNPRPPTWALPPQDGSRT